MWFLSSISRIAWLAFLIAQTTIIIPLHAQPPGKPPTGKPATASSVATPPASAAAVPTPPDFTGLSLEPAEESAAERKIRAALDTQIYADFDDRPLNDVMKKLAERLKINIQLDARAFSDAAIAVDARVTLKIRQPISARAAIAQILMQHELHWVIQEEVLVITTHEKESKTLRTRIYPVHDLVTVKLGNQQIADYDGLGNVIATTINPLSWEPAGGPGHFVSLPRCGTLSLWNLREVHDEVSTLFAALHEARLLQGIPFSDPSAKPVGAVAKAIDPRLLSAIHPMSASAREWSSRFKKAMAKPLTLKFQNETLQKVCDALSKDLDLPLILDKKGLTDAAIDADTPVTIDLEQVSARNALRLLLAPLELTFIPRDGIVLVTTRQSCKGTIAKIYPVADLLVDGQGSEQIVDPAGLVTAITNTIAPQSWEAAGGPGSIVYYGPCGVLVIVNEEQVHEDLDPLLLKLRELRQSQKIATPTGDEYHKAYLTYAKKEREQQVKAEREPKPLTNAAPAPSTPPDLPRP